MHYSDNSHHPKSETSRYIYSHRFSFEDQADAVLTHRHSLVDGPQMGADAHSRRVSTSANYHGLFFLLRSCFGVAMLSRAWNPLST